MYSHICSNFKKVKTLLFSCLIFITQLQASQELSSENYISPQNISLHIQQNNTQENDKRLQQEELNKQQKQQEEQEKSQWWQDVKNCCFFWRIAEYLNTYQALPYKEAFCCQQCQHCCNDTINILLPCGTVASLVIRDTEPKHVTNSKLRRHFTRASFYPVVTRTGLLSFTILAYSFFNIFRNNREKINQILGSDFRFCANPLLDKLVTELPTYSNSTTSNYNLQNISSLIGDLEALFSYTVDNIQINFALLPEVPSTTFLDALQQELNNYKKAINNTHYSGFRVDVYDPYWPNPITEAIRISVNTNFSSSSSFNITTNQSSSFSTGTTVTNTPRTEPACFEKKELPKSVRIALTIANEEKICLPFRYNFVVTNINEQLTIESVTNVTSIENNYYQTSINTVSTSTGLNIPSLDTTNVTVSDFQTVADTISDEAVEKLKKGLIELLVRAKFASDLYPFLAALIPWLTPGYVTSKMGIILRLRTMVGNLTQIRWILLVVGIIYLLQIIPLDLPKISIIIQYPELIFQFMLSISTNICHFQSPEEVALTYVLGEIAAQQQNIEEQIQTALNFVAYDKSVEDTYQNFSALVYQDIYRPLENDTTYFQNLLDGTLFLNDYFYSLPGKEKCDPSLLATTQSPSNSPTSFPTSSPIVGINITTLTTNIPATGTLTNCATIFDTDYLQIVARRVQEEYLIDISKAWLPLLVYPFSPLIVIGFIHSFFALFFPLARHKGNMIGTKASLLDDPKKVMQGKRSPKYLKVGNHIRVKSILPFGIACFFFVLAAINGVL